MSRRHIAAVGVAITAMLAALAPPLWIRFTGEEVALAIAPVDPLSLFRGNYVDLVYDVDLRQVSQAIEADWNHPVYVVFDDARPANAVRVEDSRPALRPGETCIRGRSRRSGRVDFPSLEQFFVTPEQGRQIEQDLSNLVAIIKTTNSCRAILLDLEPE